MKYSVPVCGLAYAFLLSACGASPNPADGQLVYPPTTWPVPASSHSAIALKPVQMKTFTSKDLGFTFMYPDSILTVEEVCGQETAQIPSAVTEDATRKKIFIAPASTIENGFGSPDCKNVDNTPEKIEASPNFYSWQISFLDNVKTEDALLKGIQAVYGSKCVLTDKTPAAVQGLFDYRLEPPKKPTMEPVDPDCPINYAVEIKFAPALGRAAYWNLGQEDKFWTDESASTSYDKQMTDSVKFL